jgi:hypothetical protein
VCEGKANLGSANAVHTPVKCLFGNCKKEREFFYEVIPFHTLDVLLPGELVLAGGTWGTLLHKMNTTKKILATALQDQSERWE